MRTYHRTICLSAHFIAAALLILGQLLVNPLTMMARTSAPTKPTELITQCGTQITTPGTYALGANLTDCRDSDGVDIAISDVTLNLAGFALDSGCRGACYAGQTGIRVSNPAGGPMKSVRILGPGTVIDFDIGILFVGVQYSQVTAVGIGYPSTACLSLMSDAKGETSHHNLFTALNIGSCGKGVQGNSVFNSKFIGNQLGSGLHILNGNGNVVKGNTCHDDNGNAAIELGGQGSTGATGNILLGNTTNSSSTGILVGSGANGNTFIGNYSWGNKVLDIDEGNSGCGTDAWKRNVFKTTNQGCVH